MPAEEKDLLEESLKGYKEKIVPVAKASLKWDKDLVFTGTTQQGYEIEFDAQGEWGCKPTDALLLSLAGCMGIDIVMILKKMRVDLTSFRMELVGERNPAPPQYFKSIEIVMYIGGKSINAQKVDRAVSLSHTTYCSVYNSLRKDMEIKVRYVIEEKNLP
ncbi:MAG TPA: OsmC family protein [Syntrophales bacterium]|nr:OsmC family protein [Syntrophales bacterium]